MSGIRVFLKDRIEYCDRESKMQEKVYPKLINKGSIKKIEGRKYWLIIKDLKKLCELLVKKGVSWEKLMEELESMDDIIGDQKELF